MTTIVGAWDLGQTIGFAVGTSDRPPSLGTHTLPAVVVGHHFGRRYSDFVKWGWAWLKTHQVEYLYIEAPFAADRRTGVELQGYIRAQFAYAGFVEWMIYELNAGGAPVKLDEVRVNDVRLHFINDQPRAQVADAMTKRMCRTLGWEPRNKHEADAAALWHYAIDDQLDHKHDFLLPHWDHERSRRTARTITPQPHPAPKGRIL